jgi:hypothetical protein
MTTDPHELYKFLVTPVIEVNNIVFASDIACWLSWRFLRKGKFRIYVTLMR